jgi:hypothetical protein
MVPISRIPALLTSTSSRPKWLTVESRMFLVSFSFVTSPDIQNFILEFYPGYKINFNRRKKSDSLTSNKNVCFFRGQTVLGRLKNCRLKRLQINYTQDNVCMLASKADIIRASPGGTTGLDEIELLYGG